MTSTKIPKGSRTTRKRGKNRVNFPKSIKTRISMKQINIIVQILFKCTTIWRNAFFQTKFKIIANVLQHILLL
jgi:hypothetical protein